MKKVLSWVAFLVILIVLMLLPGFVLYIVGDVVNKLIPDKNKGGEGEQAGTADCGL